MGRPERPVDPERGAVAAFASDLRRLRRQAGNPTYRDMAGVALYSASVLSGAAAGYRLPTLPVTLAFVAACGGDREQWRQRWLAVAGEPPVQRPRPVVAGAPPRPAQLPPRPTGHVLRMEELRRLAAAPYPPVLIHGPAGVGKSQFALTYAYRLVGELTDGQLYADLRQIPPGAAGGDAVVTGFLRALGVPDERLPGTPDQRAGWYRSLLFERNLLVLLDNVADEGQVRPLLGGSARSRTILVGRGALLGLREVRRVRLTALDRPDSIAMVAAAAPERVESDPHGCDRLADLCGDLPLALDIAARKLVARPGTPLRVLTGRLEDPAVRLDWLRLGDLSVRDCLRSALAQLRGPALGVLRRLARLPADCPVVLAGSGEAGRGVPVDEELAEELAEAGILRGPGPYRVDPLARAFVLSHSGTAAPGAPELIVRAGQTFRPTSVPA